MNIVYSSDDNYSKYAGISIKSLLENNRHIDHINIYILDNNISDVNKNKMMQIISEYENCVLKFVSCKEYLDKFQLDMTWNISISAYARLLIASLLPEDVDKVLYFDCDTIVNNSIEELWKMELGDCYFAAVQDTVDSNTKISIGLKETDRYFNSGILLINLSYWRETDIEKEFFKYISLKNGKVVHHDQGILNAVCSKHILQLPLRYNFMTIHYFFNKKMIQKYFGDKAEYFSQAEINNEKNNVVIYHFTPSFTTRPWEKNVNTHIKVFMKNMKMLHLGKMKRKLSPKINGILQ